MSSVSRSGDAASPQTTRKERADSGAGDPAAQATTVVAGRASGATVVAPTLGSGDERGPRPSGKSRFVPGETLAGRFRIVSLLGRGGMGEVYRAMDLKLGQQIALKFLPESMHDAATALSRFLAEARNARQVSHPNVCRVYDVGELEGHSFISMEWIDGETLTSLFRRIGRLPPAKALEIGLDLANGLAAIHGQGLLHRDLKPANLMIDGRGRARIADFGIAGTKESAAGREARAGTPAYMAPELFDGGEVSVRSDLYSLGLVLYELFTGRRAFEPDAAAAWPRIHRERRPRPPSRWVPDLDPKIDRLILSCLEKAPHDRPSAASQIARTLSSRREGDELLAWRPAPGSALPQRRHWTMERRLGRGGFGEAWLAVHRKTGEKRVFKLCYEARNLRALQRETTLFRLLREELGERHDIVRILDWNLDEIPYFVESEYASQGNLAEWAARRGGVAEIPLSQRLEILAQVATALAAAHSVGILHRDVKPANVLVTTDREGRPQAQLADFGIGRVTDRRRLDEAGITALGMTATLAETSSDAGTRLYMAPELLEGKPATLQSDVFALGVLLYQVVVGDLTRALAPGWERDVSDELLREDIASAVDGVPERRLGDVLRLAEKLRAVDERRRRRAAERRAVAARRREREAAERARAALERSRKRRRTLTRSLVLLALVAAILGLQTYRIAREAGRAERERAHAENAAARARNVARVAVAGEWLAHDPTRAGLVLSEVANPRQTAYAVDRIRWALQQKLALFELRGHVDSLTAVAFGPNGELIVTASEDGTARIWRADGAGEPTVLIHGAGVGTAAFSPNGDRVLTAGDDGTARIWTLAATPRQDSGAPRPAPPVRGEPRILEGHAQRIGAAAFSPLGERVVTASNDGTARVWNVDGSGVPTVLTGHRGELRSAAFSPNGDRVVTASEDATARVWNADGSGVPLVFRHEGSVRSAAFGPRGERIVTAASDRTARVWRADGSGALLSFEHDDWVWSAAFSPDGHHVVTASLDGTVRVWRADGSAEPVVLEGHRDSVFTASYSPDGDHILTASRDGTARIWNADGSGEPLVLRHGTWPLTAAFGPRGERIVTASRDGTARVWSREAALAARHASHSGHRAANRVGVPRWHRGLRSLYTASMAERNPYDWQSHHPTVEIPQAEVDAVAGMLEEGGSAVVLGGRGMGKSVFLHQLRARLERDAENRVVVIPAPPPELTVRACLDELAESLGVAPAPSRCLHIVNAYLARDGVPERLLLLFDEFDRYAQKGEPSANPPGRGFFNDLEATRRDVAGLGVMATGSLGVFVARDVLGSSFLSRAYHTHLAPFRKPQFETLAQPFGDRRRALAAEVLDALFLATGGIPALLTYGFQQLWRLEREPEERDVLDAFTQFRRGHTEYLRDLLRSVADPKLSEAPQRVLETIRQATDPLRRSDLEKALAPTGGPLDLDLIDVLRLLEAAGLVRIDGSLYSDDPLRARPISSLLDLPTSSAPVDGLAERLRRDLETLLAKLHRASADFFRPVRGQDKQLVPESVFAAHLALGLELLGWRTEREAQSAAGRTDLKLRRNGSSEVMLIEVKIWGRNDFREAQRQVESYWSENVSLGIIVELTDAELPDWAERYRRECLEPRGVEAEIDESPAPLIRAHFLTTSSIAGKPAPIDHYLVALPRRL